MRIGCVVACTAVLAVAGLAMAEPPARKVVVVNDLDEPVSVVVEAATTPIAVAVEEDSREYLNLTEFGQVPPDEWNSELLTLFAVPEGKRFTAQYVSVQGTFYPAANGDDSAWVTVSPNHVIGNLEKTGGNASLGSTSHLIGKKVWIPYGPGSRVNVIVQRASKTVSRADGFSATVSGILEDVAN